MKKALDLAVYIDADNVSWKLADKIRAVINSIGTIRRAVAIGEKSRFAGEKGWHKSNWTKVCGVDASDKKANAADFEMTMRMGEDVASRKFTGFCIVADDRDYQVAAERLRSRGVPVFGLGRGKAPESYRKVLTKYFDLSQIKDDPIVAEPKPAQKSLGPKAQPKKATCNTKKRRRRSRGFSMSLRCTRIMSHRTVASFGRLRMANL